MFYFDNYVISAFDSAQWYYQEVKISNSLNYIVIGYSYCIFQKNGPSRFLKIQIIKTTKFSRIFLHRVQRFVFCTAIILF